MRRSNIWVLVACMALACSSTDPGADEDTSGINGDGDGDGTGDGDGDGDGTYLDIGGAPNDGGNGMPSGTDDTCKKVDVIIAVDNSSSMEEEIEALSGPVFDSFPESLLAVGNGLDDFQLAVIDACNSPAAFHDAGTNGACNFSSGTNYMLSTSPTLFDEYHCAMELADPGYQDIPDACTGDDDDEQPANTIATAVSSPALDDYNAGFVREDAVLFVVAITDEDEKPNPDKEAQVIAQEIIAAKGTIDHVVFLGIGGTEFCLGDYGTAIPAPELQAVTAVFEAQDRGLYWDLCEGSLEQAFDAALELVDSACDDFEPPG